MTNTNENEPLYEAEGIVKSYNPEKGYGFIFSTVEPDKDIFVHFSQIVRTGKRELIIGERVSFLYKPYGDKGLRAYAVRPLN